MFYVVRHELHSPVVVFSIDHDVAPRSGEDLAYSVTPAIYTIVYYLPC